MNKLLPRWLHPKAFFIGVVMGAYIGYKDAANYGFSTEAIVEGMGVWFISAVMIGAFLTWIAPKYFPKRPK